MPNIPDKLINKKAKSFQGWVYSFAAMFFLGGILGSAGGGDGFLAIVIGVVLAWLGSKIKTTYNHQGSASLYK